VRVVELNTKSEKGYARPGREIVQPTVLPYNQTLAVHACQIINEVGNFTVNSCTQLSSNALCEVLLCISLIILLYFWVHNETKYEKLGIIMIIIFLISAH
jgi:hypothetical protein